MREGRLHEGVHRLAALELKGDQYFCCLARVRGRAEREGGKPLARHQHGVAVAADLHPQRHFVAEVVVEGEAEGREEGARCAPEPPPEHQRSLGQLQLHLRPGSGPPPAPRPAGPTPAGPRTSASCLGASANSSAQGFEIGLVGRDRGSGFPTLEEETPEVLPIPIVPNQPSGRVSRKLSLVIRHGGKPRSSST